MTENNEKILFLFTGGTIDSKFDGPTERKIIKTESGIPDFLNQIIKPHFKCDFKKIVMIDSTEMTDEHRAQLCSAILDSPLSKVIIAHGTDTMRDTAFYLQNKLCNAAKTVILTGALIPLDGFYNSDAPFNLGYAFALAENKPSGVYIAMNGRCFHPEDVVKNKSTGRFEQI